MVKYKCMYQSNREMLLVVGCLLFGTNHQQPTTFLFIPQLGNAIQLGEIWDNFC